MARRPNKLLRTLVPLLSVLAGLGVVLAVYANTRSGTANKTTQSTGQPANQVTPPPAEAQTDAAAQTPSPSPAPEVVADSVGEPVNPDDGTAVAQEAAEQVAEQVAEQASGDLVTPDSVQPDADVKSQSGPNQTNQPVMAALAPGLHAETFADDPLAKDFAPLGELAFDSPYEMQVVFSHVGAGIKSIRLSRELDSVQADRAARKGAVDADKHVKVQGQIASASSILVPMAAIDLTINGTPVTLNAGPQGEPVWRQVQADTPGHFEAFILDADGKRIARLERLYSMVEHSFELQVVQHAQNLTDQPLKFRWRQFGPVDMDVDTLGYGGEKRRVRFGYLLDPAVDTTRQYVFADDFLWRRTKIISPKQFPDGTLWPNKRNQSKGYELVWMGITNRYFGAVVYPLVDLANPAPDKVFGAVHDVRRVMLDTGEMVLGLEGSAITVEPGASLAMDMGMYAGPLSKEAIEAEPMPSALGVQNIVVYNFGGPCAFCTFTWLTGPLLGLLRFLHNLTQDWALAIILLVVCVRTVLHPITRWSQIRMQIFGKKMQNMGPKQKAIQEKYKDDKQQLQKEMGRLWREEGISPTGMLGCLPMFLQSPIWIALYATLYFAIDLRHEPAFFGVFQSLTNNHWPFLADLAKPDRAIFFGSNGVRLPLMGNVTSLNVLPLFLGVVFYMQQKYLQPPTSNAMTSEQKSQQKMMKVMMVVMFPVFMYNAPSGLALYFITNSTLGILESRWIRKHIEESGMLEPENLKKKPNSKGFFAKLKEMAAKQQQLKAQAANAKRTPRRVKNEAPPRKYKKKH